MSTLTLSKPSLKTEFIQYVDLCSPAVYAEVARDLRTPEDTVHAERICKVIAGRLGIFLKDALIPNYVEHAVSTRLASEQPADSSNYPGNTSQLTHYYPVSKRDPSLIADPTWQQFLPVDLRQPTVPRVLAGERQEVIESARSFGIVDPAVLRLWLPSDRR